MPRSILKILSTVFLLLLLASCSPEGCYGPKAYGYNTKGVVVSNLVGTYTFDDTNVLKRLGFTNYSGFITLKPDMTFVCSNVPSVACIPQPGIYSSNWSGKWKLVTVHAIWAVKFYDEDGTGHCSSLDLPVLGESAPHGIQLTINSDEGYWVRLHRSEGSR